MNNRYIVNDKDGNWQASYSFLLGKEKAFTYATLTAKLVKGVIIEQIDNLFKETKSYADVRTRNS